MNRIFFTGIFALGLAAVVWVGIGFVGASPLALLMTAVIAGVYGLGAFELRRYRAATASLAKPGVKVRVTFVPPSMAFAGTEIV